MNKRKKNEYIVYKKHYIIPLVLSASILISGIIMTLTDQIGSGNTNINRKKVYVEITGPQTIVLGSILLLIVCYYIRVLYRENAKRNLK